MSLYSRASLERALKKARIARAQAELIERWHEREGRIRSWQDACREIPTSKDRLSGLIESISLINTYQWHEEDRARDTDASDAVIAEVKRAIDLSNQRRVDATEALDSFLEELLSGLGIAQKAPLPLNSETPGSLVDRLSIIALKIFHMDEHSRRKDITSAQRMKFAAKLAVLKEQRADLLGCLDELMRGVLSGKRRFKTYRQFKMYNDPETNPYIKTAAGRSPAAAP